MKHSGTTLEPTGFGIYLHWPFCASKCPYCDFNSHVALRVDTDAWTAAYLSEIERIAALTPGRRVETVFFGGGTPSLMDPAIVAEVLAAIRRNWRVANDWEVTLEANPGSVEAHRFRDFRAAGVNRISLGVQSLVDTDLARLGRLHSVAEAKAAFQIARDQFPRVSFDLIYARQDQTITAWRRELAEALAMAADHLSLYQLTIEDGTAFGALHRVGRLRGLPDEDIAADMFLLTQELCATAGLPAYEVSNHARRGAESRHNILYWTGGDFAGVGPGAHGRITRDGRRHATEAERSPARWLHPVPGEGGRETVTLIHPREQAVEYLVMGLRLTRGIDPVRLSLLAGNTPDEKALHDLAGLGLLHVEKERIRATLGGRMVLNRLLADIAAAWGL